MKSREGVKVWTLQGWGPAFCYVGDPSVHMYGCRLLIGLPKGLNKIFWEGQRQSKKMLKDFLCKMGGPERQSGLVLGAWVPVEGCIQILT